MIETPEHDKLEKIADISQAIGDFLEWLNNTEGWKVCRLDSTAAAVGGYQLERWEPLYLSIKPLLAAYYGIDLDKFNEETDALFASIQTANLEQELRDK